MKKENNQEFYVEQMDVRYPRRSEIQNEIEDIILKGMPQKISFLKRMKKIYLGPGLRVILAYVLDLYFLLKEKSGNLGQLFWECPFSFYCFLTLLAIWTNRCRSMN